MDDGPKLAYIAGPYKAATARGIVENIQKAEAVAIKYWKAGYAVICPHKNSALFDGIIPDGEWIKRDLIILSRCDVIVMMQGWKDSEGAKKEHDFALQNGIEIIYE